MTINIKPEQIHNNTTWNLGEGIDFCRNLEEVLDERGWHCALTGSILYKGSSTKDLDVMIYPHKTLESGPRKDIKGFIEKHFATELMERDHTKYSDDKDVMCTYIGNKRVDFFFVS